MHQKLKEFSELCEAIKSCNTCKLNAIPLCGEGNLNARIMLITQSPGEKENLSHRMFVGPSGRVLDRLLRQAGMSRKEIYMTNIVKCHLPHNRKPKENEIEACSRWLEKEMELIKPEILVPLGFFAARYLFKKYDVKLPKNEEFYKIYGKLVWTGEVKIYPLQHPATLLYNPQLEGEMVRNYEKLSVLKQECKWRVVCPMTRYHREGKLDRKWIELYCKGDWESCKRYQAEEAGIPHPDNMLPDGTIDETLGYKFTTSDT